MTKIPFTKMHGAGNDYVVVDARSAQEEWTSLARQVCNRHYGVGADGLLLVVPSTAGDIRMRMFNPDGSEAEMCGNGIRCFAKYVLERGLAPLSGGVLRVETASGVREVAPVGEKNGRVSRARVSMGAPRFATGEVPVLVEPSPRPRIHGGSGLDITFDSRLQQDVREAVIDYPLQVGGVELRITCLSLGNPHAVAFISEPVDSLPLALLGPLMEHHAMFPQRVNFHVVNVVSQTHLRARTWERGAGLTLACGTGVCAMAVAAHVLGLVDDAVEVEMPGGTLGVTWPGHGPVTLEGPAEEVFKGKWWGGNGAPETAKRAKEQRPPE